MPLEECIPCVSREKGHSTPGRAAWGSRVVRGQKQRGAVGGGA